MFIKPSNCLIKCSFFCKSLYLHIRISSNAEAMLDS